MATSFVSSGLISCKFLPFLLMTHTTIVIITKASVEIPTKTVMRLTPATTTTAAAPPPINASIETSVSEVVSSTITGGVMIQSGTSEGLGTQPGSWSTGLAY